jgi:hypothetical protein
MQEEIQTAATADRNCNRQPSTMMISRQEMIFNIAPRLSRIPPQSTAAKTYPSKSPGCDTKSVCTSTQRSENEMSKFRSRRWLPVRCREFSTLAVAPAQRRGTSARPTLTTSCSCVCIGQINLSVIVDDNSALLSMDVVVWSDEAVRLPAVCTDRLGVTVCGRCESLANICIPLLIALSLSWSRRRAGGGDVVEDRSAGRDNRTGRPKPG